MSRARTAIVIVACLVLAALSARAALGQINERYPYVPLLALQKTNGFAKSRLAGALLAAELAKNPGAPVELTAALRRDVRDLSLEAYAMEPLDAHALGNLGLLAEGEGDTTKARQLFRAGQSLSRRDLTINLWLAQDYGRLGDVAGMLRTIDQALRSDAATRSALLPLLSQNVANPAFVEPLIDLLRKDPEWEPDFWAEAFKSPPALVNVAQVRISRARDGYPGTESYDRSLMNALVEERHFAEAEQLSRALKARSSATADRVANSDFGAAPGLAPFDWELFFSGSRSAQVVPERGELRVDISDGESGIVARQLVSLPDEAYVLRSEAADWDAADEAALYVRIRCAEVDGGEPVRIDLSRASQSTPFRTPVSGCGYNWVEIIAAGQSGQNDNVITLTSLSIVPASGAGARGSR